MHKKLNSFEGLRGLMALWVVVGHSLSLCGLELDSKVLSILISPLHAVNVFILLSGFVISMVLDIMFRGTGNYLIRRSFRLFPVYLVCLLFSLLFLNEMKVVLEHLPWHSMHNGARAEILAESQEHLTAHFTSHLFLAHGLIPHSVLAKSSWTIMEQAWSLTLEYQFYILALLLPLVKKNMKYLALATVVLFVVMFAGQTGIEQSSFIGSRLYLFLGGMSSWYLYKNREKVGNDVAIKGIVVVGIFVISVDWVNFIGVSIWSVVLISEMSAKMMTLRQCLSGRVALFIGKISYSVYCSHMLVLYALLSVLTQFQIKSSSLSFFILMVIGVPITIVVSALLHRLVEAPMIKLSKKITQA